MAQPFLQMNNITKAFPGVKALDDVQLQVKKGEIHALLGENGAGKSTLMKILSGVHSPDGGQIVLDGEPALFSTTKEAEQAGIAIIYQELNLIPQMTVAENIFLGREPKTRLGLVDYTRMRQMAAKELASLQTDINPNDKIADIRVGKQQLVEIAKALSLHAKVLIMDEPTSALSDAEVQKLFAVIKSLREKGVAIIYITHKLDEIFAMADRVTVLRDGKYIKTVNVTDTDSASLINMMVGRDLEDLFPKIDVPIGEQVMSLQELSVKHPMREDRMLLENISFDLHQGEILGVAGLMGAGRTELLLSLFGAPPGKISKGSLTIKGQKADLQSPVQAIDKGLALVTEDRKTQGLFLQLSVKDNITISSLSKAVKNGFLSRKQETELVNRYMDKLAIKAPSLAMAVEKLSGGNQQKVILAKWLLTDPTILLLDDPTRGIDVGAKTEIYNLINQFVAEGMAIILVSSELPELLALSDRILVLNQGRMTALLDRKQATEQSIMSAATSA